MAAVILVVDKGLPSVYTAFVKGRIRDSECPGVTAEKEISSRMNGLPARELFSAL
jgi:hypothetical protein